MEENYNKEIETVKKIYEEEARKKAEEFNEFKEKYTKKLAAQKQEYENQMKDKDEKYDLLKALSAHKEKERRKKHQEDVNDLVKCVTRKSGNVKKVADLLMKQEQQMKKVETEAEKTNLQGIHERELDDLIQDLLKEVNTGSSCSIL